MFIATASFYTIDSHVPSHIEPFLTDNKVNGVVDQAEYSWACGKMSLLLLST